MAAQALQELWSPAHLERLARTYWRFLSRVTLGLLHVSYSERGRAIVLLAPPLALISFHPPEYELDPSRGLKDQREMSSTLVTTEAGSAAAGFEGVSEGSTGNPRQGQANPVPLPANPLPESLQYVTVYSNGTKGGFALVGDLRTYAPTPAGVPIKKALGSPG